jgi:penicillin V acylase-like amidase (Ntn superfamily)
VIQRKGSGAAAGLIVWLLSFHAASPCTTFCLARGEEVVFGRNYDFEIGDGMVVINPRGLSKRSILDGRPASWSARYGSLTFNQYGRDFPTGGMNEKGLVVELMWLDGTRYPPADDRPEVGILEWIQLQLDTRQDVADLLAHLGDVRPRGTAPLHYLVADASGAAAAVEFLEGRPVVHTGASLPEAVLANDTYGDSLAELERPGANSRFARAARGARQWRDGGGAAVPAAFDILDQVAQGTATRWSIVYDLRRREVHFRTASHRPIRRLALSGFDFDCDRPVLMLEDINAPLNGNVTAHLAPWTPAANLKLVSGSYRKVSFLRQTPESELRATAAHPGGDVCAAPPPAAR